MEKFRWCFIGTGRLAHQVASLITASGRHEITSVYSRRPESAREFAASFGGTVYESAEEAVSAPDVDGVYVVTPHNSHYVYAKAAVAAGRPCLCEKAFTLCGETTDRLLAFAKEKGVYLCEAMWTWFAEPPYQVKQWIEEGAIGRPLSAKLSYNMKSMNYAPRVSDPALGGGALLDVGVYPLTYLYRLFGKPLSMTCEGEVEGGIDRREKVRLRFEGLDDAVFTSSIVDFKGLERLKIRGEKGTIRAALYHCGPTVKLHRRGSLRTEVFSGAFGYLREFDLAADEIRRGLTESEWVPHQATSDVMRLMDECRRQMGLTYDCELTD